VYELKVLADPVGIEGAVRVDRFPTKKCKALLCYLAMSPSHRARRAAIIADLWPEEFEDIARKALRQTLYHVRATLKTAGLDPDVLRSTVDHVWLDPELVSVDFDRFQELAAAGLDATDFETARVKLAAALEACPSGFDGADDGLWVAAQRERVADIVRRVRLRICRGYLDRSDSQCAHDCAMAVVVEHPYDESAYEIAIRARLQLRDRAGARELFDRLEREVSQGLGGKVSLSWEDLADSYPIADRPGPMVITSSESTASPRARRTLLQRLVAVAIAAAVLIGGWTATGVRGFGRENITPTEADAILRTAFARGSTKERIAAVRQVFEAAWTGAYAATEDEWDAVIRRHKEPIVQTIGEARATDADATLVIAGAGWRYFSNNGMIPAFQETLRGALDRSSREPSPERARALCSLAFDITETGHWNEALPLAQEALEMYRNLGDEWGVAHANRCVGFAYAFGRDWKRSHEYYHRALHGFKTIGNREGMAVTQLCLSFATTDSQPGLRMQWTIESVESYLAVGNKWGIEYAGDALLALVFREGTQYIDRSYGLRATRALERHLDGFTNPFSEKSLETRRALAKLGVSLQLEEVSSRQLEWFARYQKLNIETAAVFYGACGSNPAIWSWLQEKIEADRQGSGRLTAAVLQGKRLGAAQGVSRVRRELKL
jgi:DNA-binding SARP family transcriptional activator